MPVPAIPYRGIQPFRYADHAIFFERDAEAARLANLVAVYRGVFLYGDSGNGKSSLLNAGLLPRLGAMGMTSLRVRVQPRAGAEFVVEPIAAGIDGIAIPHAFAAGGDDGVATVLSIKSFVEHVRITSRDHRLLLVFDQFEELITLFDEPEARDASEGLVTALVSLLRGELPVKLLFAFREDYLGRVKQLLAACPELVDQALRLGPPNARALSTIIRGPFERHPGHFERELTPALSDRLRRELEERFGAGELSLSEVQTVCLRLWQSAAPDALLTARGVQGVLEDHLGEALDDLDPDLREAAVALLGHMVTEAGTRNVVSADDLVERVRTEQDIPLSLLARALNELERESKLVRREHRRDLFLYEITSEFLVPWIRRRREDVRRARERRRDRRRLRVLTLFAAAVLLVAALIAVLAVAALHQRDAARRRQAAALSLALASTSRELAVAQPDAALAIGFEAYREAPSPDSRFAVMTSLRAVTPLMRTLRNPGMIEQAVLSPDGRVLATTSGFRTTSTFGVPSSFPPGGNQTIRLWDVHTGRVSGTIRPPDLDSNLAFSPDGLTLVGGGSSNTGQIWDARTGRVRRSFSAQDGDIVAVAFSPNGDTVTTANDEGVARVWSARTGAHQQTLRTGLAAIETMAFSPDGRALALGSDDGIARVWNTRSWHRIATLRGDTDDIAILAFGRDGHTLATGGSTSRTVRVWDVVTGRQVCGLRAENGAVTAFGFSRDGRTAAAGTDTGVAYLWSAGSCRPTSTLRGHNADINAVAFSPDGRTLATASGDRTARIWDVATGRVTSILRGHESNVTTVAFGPHGRSLVTASDDGTARIWNPRISPLTDTLHGHAGGVRAVAFSPGGSTLATTTNDGHARLWSVDTGAATAILHGRTDGFSPLAFASSGRTLATVSAGGRAFLWDAHTHDVISMVGGLGSVEALAFSPNRHTMATVGSDETRLWNGDTGKPSVALESTAGGFNVAFSPDGRMIASAGADTTRIWDARTGKLLFTLRRHTNTIYALAFSPDGHTLATVGYDKTRLWSTENGRQKAVIPTDTIDVFAVRFSPDGHTITTACGGKAACLWDSRTGQRVAALASHGDTTLAVAYSRNGRTLATASDNNVARLWDARVGTLTTTLRGHDDVVFAIAYGPVGQNLATGSADGTARLWTDVDWRTYAELRKRVCAPLGGGIGRAEWRRDVSEIPYRNGCG